MAQRNSFWKTGGFDILAKVPVHMKSKKKAFWMPEQKPYPQKMNCLWKGFLPIFKGSFFGHGKTAIFGLAPPKIQYKPQPLWENTGLAKHSENKFFSPGKSSTTKNSEN